MNFKLLTPKKNISNAAHLVTLIFKYPLADSGLQKEYEPCIIFDDNSIGCYFITGKRTSSPYSSKNQMTSCTYIPSLDLFCDGYEKVNDFYEFHIFSHNSRTLYTFFYKNNDVYYVYTPYNRGCSFGTEDGWPGFFLPYGKYKKEYIGNPNIKSRNEIFHDKELRDDCSIYIEQFSDIFKLKSFLKTKKLSNKQVQQLNKQDFLETLSA
jgi:hypothetical protein